MPPTAPPPQAPPRPGRSPFVVLAVCLGNICRSPMAERLLALSLRQRVGDEAEQRYLAHSAGTGSWHVGQPMSGQAARQLVLRGADADGFRARRVTAAMVDAADLILCATSEHAGYLLDLRPDAVARTFVLGEFGRLLAGGVDLAALPPLDGDPGSALGRGVAQRRSAQGRGPALVAAADAARRAGQRRLPARREDDLDDPWGLPDREYARVANEIEQTVVPLAAALTG